MKLVITDDQGNHVGELYTDKDHQWRDLLLYVSQRWEESSRDDSASVLQALLAEHL